MLLHDEGILESEYQNESKQKRNNVDSTSKNLNPNMYHLTCCLRTTATAGSLKNSSSSSYETNKKLYLQGPLQHIDYFVPFSEELLEQSVPAIFVSVQKMRQHPLSVSVWISGPSLRPVTGHATCLSNFTEKMVLFKMTNGFDV